jgi:Protein of unknown function (DUF4058)
MPSPFPGMNPYLEAIGHDFHERLLPAAATYLVPQIRPRYIVLIDENVYLHDIPQEERRLIGRPDLSVIKSEWATMGGAAAGVLEAPTQVLLPEQDVESVSYLKVLDRESREVVTVIEMLSPTNKRPGDHRAQYLAKRSAVRQSEAHLVEIDLVRGGQPMPAEGRPKCTYSVLVSRADRRPHADFWPFGLRDPFPPVPVPLKPGDGNAWLDLRSILDRVYDDSGYEDFIYQRDPEPPLTGDDDAWAGSFVPAPPR